MDGEKLFRKTEGAFSLRQCDSAWQQAEEMILNYCNLSAVPEQLRCTCMEMAEKILRASAARQGETERIASVAVGDAKVAFANTAATDALTELYAGRLNRYRRICF